MQTRSVLDAMKPVAAVMLAMAVGVVLAHFVGGGIRHVWIEGAPYTSCCASPIFLIYLAPLVIAIYRNKRRLALSLCAPVILAAVGGVATACVRAVKATELIIDPQEKQALLHAGLLEAAGVALVLLTPAITLFVSTWLATRAVDEPAPPTSTTP